MTLPGARDYVIIHKGLHLLDVTEIERRIIGFLVALKVYAWTNGESTALPVGVALELDASIVSVRRGLLALARRRWVKRGVNGRGHHWVQLTEEVTDACRIALRHQQVRRWVGSVQWTAHVKHQNDMAEFCELLLTEAMTLNVKRTADAVRAVSNSIFLTYPNLRRVKPPPAAVPTLDDRRKALSQWTKSVHGDDQIGPRRGPNRSNESGI